MKDGRPLKAVGGVARERPFSAERWIHALQQTMLPARLAVRLPRKQRSTHLCSGFGQYAQSGGSITGGYRTDSINGVAVDSKGYIYVGSTASPAFPKAITINPSPSTGHQQSVFIAKLTPDGEQFVYVKVMPAGDFGRGVAIAVDQTGNAYVGGNGALSDAVAPSFGSAHQTAGPFVLKLDPSGSKILYLAYLDQTVNGLAIDRDGNAYVTGSGASGVSVSKVNSSGTALIYSMGFGGSGTDIGKAIAVDASGATYVTGSTSSADFPATPGVFQSHLSTTIPGTSNAFVAKINGTGTALVYATYLGGTTSFSDSGNAIAVDSAGNAFAAGTTSSADFPTTPGAFREGIDPSPYGIGAAFVAKLDPSASRLVYSTLLKNAQANAIALDSLGNAHITGSAYGGLPTKAAFQPEYTLGACPFYTLSGSTPIGFQACLDAFAAAFNPSGSALVYSTYLNGGMQHMGFAIAIDTQDNVIVGGMGSQLASTTNSISNSGSAFVVKMSAGGVPPYFTRGSITNAANFISGLVRPGGLATIFCSSLTLDSEMSVAVGTVWPTALAGVQVNIGGVAAPLYSVSTTFGQQINLQVPFEANGGVVEVRQNGISTWVIADTEGTPPALFTSDGERGLIQHATDYSIVTPQSPASPGEIIVVYGTGLGLVTPLPPSGTPAPGVAPTTILPEVTIAGRAAVVLYAGLTPGYIGLYQLNIRVPADTPTGDQDLVASFLPYYPNWIGGPGVLKFTRRDSKPVTLPVR